MRIVVAQLNPTVGDISGNTQKIMTTLSHAAIGRADLVVMPEMTIPGYPPEDLLQRRDFVDANLKALRRVTAGSRKYPKLHALVGYVDRSGAGLHNAVALVRAGRVKGRYFKRVLPNYGVFDEKRYFVPGAKPFVTSITNVRTAVTICEDLWLPNGPAARSLSSARARLIVNVSASPFEAGKLRAREKLLKGYAVRHRSDLVYANLVGGQDELVFDGQSLVLDRRGEVVGRGAAFAEELRIVDLVGGRIVTHGPLRAPLPEIEEIYGALVLGVRDYARKNGFKGALVGLSGGVDSALTAAIAADAVGSRNVTGVGMPSRFTSRASRVDSREVAVNLGIRWLEFPVERMFRAYLATLGKHVSGPVGEMARQNLQARIRGALLMALSNRYGCLLLATGNKSEMGVGYATLYGDLAGGFAALKDIPKTLVYRLARWRNACNGAPVIPGRTLTRAPSAELRANQRDDDSLPPYAKLDPILKSYVEDGLAPAAIARRGFSLKVVAEVARMVERAEYKRRQAPPGVKIQAKAFGRDRRNPITHGFKP